MLEQANPFRSTFALAGWVFADLLLIFAVLFFANSPASHADLAGASPIAAARGSLVVSLSSGVVSPYSGGCIRIGETRVCDNDSADANPAGGTIAVDGLAPGSYQVEVEASQTVQPPERKTVNIHQDEEQRIDFVLAPILAETASATPVPTSTPTVSPSPTIAPTSTSTPTPSPTATPTPEATAIPQGRGVIYTRNPVDNAPIPGACYQLAGPATVDVCDNETVDTDPEAGNIAIDGLPVGYYTVEQTGLEAGFDPAANTTLQVTGQTGPYVVFYNRPQTGNLAISLAAGDLVVGGCIALSGAGSDTATTYCDNDSGDADPAAGRILVTRLSAGTYTVSGDQDNVPDGYANAPGQTVEVAGGGQSSVGLLYPPAETPDASGNGAGEPTVGPALPGRAQLITRSGSTGDDLSGVCYALTGPATITVCDGGDGDGDAKPGRIRIGSLPSGTYALAQTTAPDGYRMAGVYTFIVVADQLNSFVVYNVPARITGACVPALDPEMIELTNIPVTYPLGAGDRAAQDSFLAAFRAALEPELAKRGESWDTFKGGVVLTFGRLTANQTGPGSAFAQQINDLILTLPQFEGAGRKDFISLTPGDFGHIDISIFIFRTTCG